MNWLKNGNFGDCSHCVHDSLEMQCTEIWPKMYVYMYYDNTVIGLHVHVRTRPVVFQDFSWFHDFMIILQISLCLKIVLK